ncbi:hypothetical protein BH10BAC4_BH10BAC4_03180 [soil metagenome]
MTAERIITHYSTSNLNLFNLHPDQIVVTTLEMRQFLCLFVVKRPLSNDLGQLFMVQLHWPKEMVLINHYFKIYSQLVVHTNHPKRVCFSTESKVPGSKFS